MNTVPTPTSRSRASSSPLTCGLYSRGSERCARVSFSLSAIFGGSWKTARCCGPPWPWRLRRLRSLLGAATSSKSIARGFGVANCAPPPCAETSTAPSSGAAWMVMSLGVFSTICAAAFSSAPMSTPRSLSSSDTKRFRAPKASLSFSMISRARPSSLRRARSAATSDLDSRNSQISDATVSRAARGAGASDGIGEMPPAPPRK